jgi:CheY-like chemotaxis protein
MGLCRILLVDEDSDDFVLFSEIVKELNPEARITYVQDSCDLEEYLKPPLPEIIFLDFNMPKVDGIECLKRIRGRKELEKIPVIVYSVYYDKVIDAHQNGANYFIVKQLSVSKVKGSIDAMLNRDWNDENTFKSFDVYRHSE